MIKAIGTIAAVLFFIAIMVRLSSDKQVPGTITNGFNAMSNIFKGVFRG